jgi:hypothetical protein
MNIGGPRLDVFSQIPPSALWVIIAILAGLFVAAIRSWNAEKRDRVRVQDERKSLEGSLEQPSKSWLTVQA